jgi:sec-independent protein translocase protein TatB
VFNFQGSELIIILLLALVVLGPEKLPEAMRKAGRMYADLKKMSTSFQEEFRSVVDEPMRELRDTANVLRDSADFTKLAEGERNEKPKSAEMGDAPAAAEPSGEAPIPAPDLPFTPSSPSEPTGSTDGFGNLPSVRRGDASSAAEAPSTDASGDGDEEAG